MADAVARQHYAGDKRPVECKQKTREGSAAHHEHVEAKSETGEATVTQVDVNSGHGGANFGDNGARVIVLDKMTKQQGIKHHGIEMEL